MLDSLLRSAKERKEKMNSNEQSESNARISRQPSLDIFTNSANSIAIYTVLCILRRMKREIGLEAMLEYLDKYLETVETHNAQLKLAVEKALGIMSVGKMYKDAMK
jgi:hypothetical protein